MKWNKVSRRHFLQGVGGFSLALPLLPSLLLGKEAKAASGPAPVRFIGIWTPNGRRLDYFLPNQDPTNVLSTQAWVRDMPLSSFSGSQISQVLGTSLNPYLNKLTLIKGLDHVIQLGHNSQSMLGNFDGATVTIDQLLAQSAKIYPTEPAIRSLLLSDNFTARSFSWDYSGGSLTRLPAYTDPQAAFDRVFYAATPAKTSLYTKVVDLVYQDYSALMSNSRLGSMDKAAVQSHMDNLSQLQNRLKNAAPLTCGAQTRPATANWDASNSTAIMASYRALCDVIVAAIKCGSTRIATLATGVAPNYSPNDWHGASHGREPEANPTNLAINKYINDQIFAYLVQSLDVPESNGQTYLDNSLVFWGNEISMGWTHDGFDTQVMLAGSMGGYLKTGRYLDYSQWGDPTKVASNETYPAGRPYNQLLVTILQGMGLVPADYETGGKPGYGAYTVPDAAHMALYTNNIADVGNPLPYLTTR